MHIFLRGVEEVEGQGLIFMGECCLDGGDITLTFEIMKNVSCIPSSRVCLTKFNVICVLFRVVVTVFSINYDQVDG